MTGFNLLGINTHSEDFHKPEISLQDILKGASKEMDSFKEVEEAFKNIYTKDEIDLLLAGYSPEDGISLGDYLKKTDADATYQPKGDYLTEHQSLEEYAKKSELPDTSQFIKELPDYSNVYQPKGEYLTSEDIADLATSSEVSAQNERINALENSNFITSADLADYAKTDSTVVLSAITENGEVLTYNLVKVI